MTTYYVLRSRNFLQKFTFSIVNRNRRQWTVKHFHATAGDLLWLTLTYSILAYVNKNRIRCNYNTVVQLKQLKKEDKLFPELFVAIVALKQAVLFTTLQHRYVLPLVTFLCKFRLPYETYHTRILFFERYVRTLAYSILAYAYIRAML